MGTLNSSLISSSQLPQHTASPHKRNCFNTRAHNFDSYKTQPIEYLQPVSPTLTNCVVQPAFAFPFPTLQFILIIHCWCQCKNMIHNMTISMQSYQKRHAEGLHLLWRTVNWYSQSLCRYQTIITSLQLVEGSYFFFQHHHTAVAQRKTWLQSAFYFTFLLSRNASNYKEKMVQQIIFL